MDLFTGKKIADLRKYNSLSQEALAEKVGVSRQAISKWERSEASPDMDNIVALARVFNVTVDDLLGDKKAQEITDFSAVEAAKKEAVQNAAAPAEKEEEQKTAQPTDLQAEETQPAAAPAAQTEVKQQTAVPAAQTEKKPAKAKKEKRIRAKKEKKPKTHYKPQITKKMNRIPVFILVPIIYVLLGITKHIWHPGWLMAFIIPVYYFTAFAFNAKDRRGFFLKLPVPFVLIPVFLYFGFVYGAWHPAWMVFLILPIYYWIAAMVKR